MAKSYLKPASPSSPNSPVKYINPYKLFFGAFVPNWLLTRTEISQGAKLCYARLCQYADKKTGIAYPKRDTLAGEIGVKDRQVDRYVDELEDHELIEVKRQGKRERNRYRFLSHPWMKSDSSHKTSHPQSESSHKTSGDSSHMATPLKRKDSLEEIQEERVKPSHSNGSDLRVKEFMDHWYQEFKTRYGKPYIVRDKELPIIRGLLKEHDLDGLRCLAAQFFDDDDRWVAEHAGYTIAVFASQINRLGSMKENRWQSHKVKAAPGKYDKFGR